MNPGGDTGAEGGPAGSDRGMVLFAALAIGAVASFGVYLWKIAPEPPPDLGEGGQVLAAPLELPEFALVDHRGAGFGRGRLEGRWSLLFFGYTYCPDVCPTTLQRLASAQRLLAERGDPGSTLPQVVFVSVDPERDTVERLAEYVAHFDPDFVGVTGSAGEIDRLARSVGAFHRKGQDDGAGGYLVDHSVTVFLVDPDARLWALLDDPHEPGEFADTLGLAQSARERS